MTELAPVPSGEVETPCATCGGSGKAPPVSLDAGWPCATCLGSGVAPDCGVETPEAARAKAIEAMAVVIYTKETGMPDCWGTESAGARKYYCDVASAALDAAEAQGWTPPGGTE